MKQSPPKNSSILSLTVHLFSVVRTRKICCPRDSSVSWSIMGSNLHAVRPQNLITSLLEVCNLQPTFPHCHTPAPGPWQPPLSLYSVSLAFYKSTPKWNRTVFVWFTSLSIGPQGAPMLSQRAGTPSSYGWIAFHCIWHVPLSICPLRDTYVVVLSPIPMPTLRVYLPLFSPALPSDGGEGHFHYLQS